MNFTQSGKCEVDPTEIHFEAKIKNKIQMKFRKFTDFVRLYRNMQNPYPFKIVEISLIQPLNKIQVADSVTEITNAKTNSQRIKLIDNNKIVRNGVCARIMFYC